MHIAELFDIRGQVAIVTGASSGLGRIMAAGLAEAGCAVVLGARREDRLAVVRDAAVAAGGRALVVPCDVRDPGHADLLVDAALREYGRLDGVILNAGVGAGSPAEHEDLQRFHEVMEVNVAAVMRLASAGARVMINRGEGGWMITLSSILGKRAGTGVGVAAYTASKGAIEQLTRELSRQWGPHGIRVNALAPGYFPTPMNAPMVEGPGRLESIIARIPLGRHGEPDDLAGVAVFLASRAGAYITGQSIGLDGGMAAW